MIDLDISVLRLNIENARGHEHRVQLIAVRATEILTARLEEQNKDKDASSAGANAAGATGVALSLDLNRTGNEQAARAIAEAWLDAITLRLEA
jgi:hypothetical protein